MATKNLKAKRNDEILASAREAQKMVWESESTTASAYERGAKARRVEWALEYMTEAVRRGLVNEL